MKMAAIISSFTPETAILDEMEKALKEYRDNPNDSTRGSLITFSMVWLQKTAIAKNAKGLDGILKEIEDLDKMKTVFDHTKNHS